MTTPLRCAIYTRVSSDAGLEQDFNSLDAQRESAEAYVKSQAHEGWRLVRERFDDGGYSGGTMERPALQRLLALIAERRIDIVVVYKVDRLTRSLADFAKLVELFDTQKVSFVSVTQSFNTTTSMGRLTLNVLLSFAQFEREVTGERIRDKISASKKKGLWMGGVVPFGYRVEDRKLIVEKEEAAHVRLMFELYLDLRSIPALQAELRARQIRTRERILASGRKIGGGAFTNGPLAYILRNRHYLGEINHKDKSWPGEHEPIVAVDLFERVQNLLTQQKQRRSPHVLPSHALLKGKLFNAAGEAMVPSYTLKKGLRYRYYVSISAVQGQSRAPGMIHRVPAGLIEDIVINAVSERSPISGLGGRKANDRQMLASSVDKVIVDESTLTIRLRVRNPEREAERQVDAAENPDLEDSRIETLVVPFAKPSNTRRRQILLPDDAAPGLRPIRVDEQARLIAAIARARHWLDELIEGRIEDVADIARREDRSERSVRMILSLAFLDPALVKAACAGALPRGFGLSRLMDLPPRFADQWRALGLTRPV